VGYPAKADKGNVMHHAHGAIVIFLFIVFALAVLNRHGDPR
jgi:hypothetical protein